MVEGISSLYDLFETSIKEMDDKPVIEEDPRGWKDINQGNYVMRMSKETFYLMRIEDSPDGIKHYHSFYVGLHPTQPFMVEQRKEVPNDPNMPMPDDRIGARIFSTNLTDFIKPILQKVLKGEESLEELHNWLIGWMNSWTGFRDGKKLR